jgi:hypothetical protein
LPGSAQRYWPVNPWPNKDIILELLVRLETEKDMAKLEIYRSALERVVHATPDDI